LTIAASAVVKQDNYAFVEGAGVAPKVFAPKFDNLFSVSLPATNYLKSFVYYILSLPQAMRPKTAAYASNDDFFTQPQIDAVRTLLEEGGVQTAYYNIYPSATTNYAPIAQQVIHAHPDVVILGTNGQQDSVAFMKIFKQQRFNPSAIIATAGPDQGAQFTGPLGGPQSAEGIFVPNGGWFPTINNYQNTQFVKDYTAKYGGSPIDISADTVEAYSVGQVLEQAVTKIHSLDNTKLIQELHIDIFNTLQGAVKFAADGQNTVAAAFLFQWQGGKLIVVFPSSSAEANPEFPKKAWP
jgi:branched-chain amino acid transport system substrate-binding protein